MKKQSLFITGASGYIGSHFLQMLKPEEYADIYCIGRTPEHISPLVQKFPNLKFIQADLMETAQYQSFLEAADVVLHLAAATGKMKPKVYFRVNVEGTKALLEKCRQSRIQKILYVSTIAVKYLDKTRYYYAQSKLQAEQAVQNSQINYTIVRPTIVIGKESAGWKNLMRLAKPPLSLIFGDGKVNIQPIYIDDLNDILRSIIEQDLFENNIFELGGPEVLSMEHFIKKICSFYYQSKAATIHIPLKILIPMLSVVENWCYDILPLNVGQLAPFHNDSTIEYNQLYQSFIPEMKNTDQMIKQMMEVV